MMNSFNIDPQDLAMRKLRRYDRFIIPAGAFRSLCRMFRITVFLASAGLVFHVSALAFGCACGIVACLIPYVTSTIATRMKLNYLKAQLFALAIKLKQNEEAERQKKDEESESNEHDN